MKKLLVLIAFATSAFAQTQPKIIALKAARLFDGTADAVVNNAVVVVAGNRIVGVNVPIPAGAQVIDLGDGDPIPPARGVPQQGPLNGVCNGADECRAAVRYQIKYGADVIKFMPSGGVLSLADPVDAPELSQDEMNAIVEEAHHWGRKVAAHCHGDAAAKMAVQAGVDSIEHGSFMSPQTLAMMKEHGTYLVPT